MIAVEFAGKDVSKPVLFLRGDERIEDYLPFLALAGIERHDLEPQFVVELVYPRMLPYDLGDISLLLGMRRDDAHGWRRVMIETLGNLFHDPLRFKGVHIALVDETIVLDRLEFDDILDRFPPDFHHLQAVPVEILRGETDHFGIGSEVLLELNREIGDRLYEIEHTALDVEQIYLRPHRIADIGVILCERLDEILHEGNVNLQRGARCLHVSELVPVA